MSPYNGEAGNNDRRMQRENRQVKIVAELLLSFGDGNLKVLFFKF